MSVGKLLDRRDVFELAKRHHKQILIPSGAVAGIDAIKAASLDKIKSITLTTRKPSIGFKENAYIKEQKIRLDTIKEETLIFEGSVTEAVKHFPQNINVAATLALAGGDKNKVTVRIMTSPKYKTNSHEVVAVGAFGRMTSLTENVICPDNPKTSYLAVLSALQTIHHFVHNNEPKTPKRR